jgi:hypothetical protein
MAKAVNIFFQVCATRENKIPDKILTCFAIPKSASLTRPVGSTRILAPLMSLHTIKTYEIGMIMFISD